MRYLLICLLAVACVFSTTAVQQVKAQEGSAVLSPEQISGESAILIDAKTGQVLFEKIPTPSCIRQASPRSQPEFTQSRMEIRMTS